MKYEHEISDKQFLTFFMPQKQRSAFFYQSPILT